MYIQCHVCSLQDKDVNYQLTAFVSVSFSTTREQTTDHGQEPDTDSVSPCYQVHIS